MLALVGVTEVPGRARRAEELREIGDAALAQSVLHPLIGERDALRSENLGQRDHRLPARHCLERRHLARVEVDAGLVGFAAIAQDDGGRARNRLPGAPGVHRLLRRLEQRDAVEHGVGAGVSGVAEQRHRRSDLARVESIERMRCCHGGGRERREGERGRERDRGELSGRQSRAHGRSPRSERFDVHATATVPPPP